MFEFYSIIQFIDNFLTSQHARKYQPKESN